MRPRFSPLTHPCAQRDIGHRVLDPVVEPRRARRKIPHRHHADARFTTGETLRSEVEVRLREDGPDPELPVELVQRGRAERVAQAAPGVHAVGDAVHRRQPRAGHGVAAFGQVRVVVRGRRSGRNGGLEIVRIVVAPVVEPDARGDGDLRDGGHDVLQEHAHAPLGAAGHAPQVLGAPRHGVEAILFAVSIHPAVVGA